ncbi:MAG: hypothetical protein ACOX4B_05025 [Bacillota bacterium]
MTSKDNKEQSVEPKPLSLEEPPAHPSGEKASLNSEHEMVTSETSTRTTVTGDSAVKPAYSTGTTAQRLREKYLQASQDLPLKLLTQYLLSSMGYVTFVETRIAGVTYGRQFRREQISDIDVLAIRFENVLDASTVVVECKSGGGNALDHLLKLDGVCHLMQATRGILVQAVIPKHAREVAGTLGHTTWDEAELRQVMNSLDLRDSDLDDHLLQTYVTKADLRRKAYETCKQFGRFVSSEYWFFPEYRKVQTLIAWLPRLARSAPDEEACRLLFDEATLLLGISLLRFAGNTIRNHLSDPIGSLKDQLFGGALESQRRW